MLDLRSIKLFFILSEKIGEVQPFLSWREDYIISFF